MVLGVFTNGLGHTSLYRPGVRLGRDDPRDVASIPAADLLDGATLPALAAHLRGWAQRLEQLAADGWVLWSIHGDGFAITDAPERVEPDLGMPVRDTSG